MTWLIVACWIGAIAAMAYAHEYLAGVLFFTGMAIGVWSDRRDTQRRAARETHRQYMDEVRRHR
jgi:hypothetical protein